MSNLLKNLVRFLKPMTIPVFLALANLLVLLLLEFSFSGRISSRYILEVITASFILFILAKFSISNPLNDLRRNVLLIWKGKTNGSEIVRLRGFGELRDLSIILRKVLAFFMKERSYHLKMYKKYLSTLETIKDGVILIDSSMKVELMNRSAEEILNLDKRKWVGKKVDDLLNELSFKFTDFRDRDEFEQNLKVGRKWKRLRFRISVKDERMVILISDITELDRLRKNIENLKRYAIIGEILSGISHDIKTPLTNIKLIHQILRRSGNVPERERNLLLKLGDEIEKLESKIRESLDALKRRIPKREISIIGILDEILETVKMKADMLGVRLIRRYRGDAVIKVEVEQMKTVLTNIILNAIESGSSEIVVSSRIGKLFVHILIVDNGKGIGEDEMERIFEPFYSTKPSGFGVGLAIVKKIVTSRKWKLLIRSIENRGTAFSISIPKR